MSEQVFYLAVLVVAVVVSLSLVYVGVQIKRHARNSSARFNPNSSAEVMKEFRALYVLMAQDQALADIFRACMHDIETSSVADKFRFTLIAHNFFRLFEEAYFRKEAGELASKDWHGITEQFYFLKDMPGFKAFWRDRKFLFSEEFCEYYEKEVMPVEAHTRFDYK